MNYLNHPNTQGEIPTSNHENIASTLEQLLVRFPKLSFLIPLIMFVIFSLGSGNETHAQTSAGDTEKRILDILNNWDKHTDDENIALISNLVTSNIPYSWRDNLINTKGESVLSAFNQKDSAAFLRLWKECTQAGNSVILIGDLNYFYKAYCGLEAKNKIYAKEGETKEFSPIAQEYVLDQSDMDINPNQTHGDFSGQIPQFDENGARIDSRTVLSNRSPGFSSMAESHIAKNYAELIDFIFKHSSAPCALFKDNSGQILISSDQFDIYLCQNSNPRRQIGNEEFITSIMQELRRVNPDAAKYFEDHITVTSDKQVWFDDENSHQFITDTDGPPESMPRVMYVPKEIIQPLTITNLIFPALAILALGGGFWLRNRYTNERDRRLKVNTLANTLEIGLTQDLSNINHTAALATLLTSLRSQAINLRTDQELYLEVVKHLQGKYDESQINKLVNLSLDQDLTNPNSIYLPIVIKYFQTLPKDEQRKAVEEFCSLDGMGGFRSALLVNDREPNNLRLETNKRDFEIEFEGEKYTSIEHLLGHFSNDKSFLNKLKKNSKNIEALIKAIAKDSGNGQETSRFAKELPKMVRVLSDLDDLEARGGERAIVCYDLLGDSNFKKTLVFIIDFTTTPSSINLLIKDTSDTKAQSGELKSSDTIEAQLVRENEDAVITSSNKEYGHIAQLISNLPVEDQKLFNLDDEDRGNIFEQTVDFMIILLTRDYSYRSINDKLDVQQYFKAIIDNSILQRAMKLALARRLKDTNYILLGDKGDPEWTLKHYTNNISSSILAYLAGETSASESTYDAGTEESKILVEDNFGLSIDTSSTSKIHIGKNDRLHGYQIVSEDGSIKVVFVLTSNWHN